MKFEPKTEAYLEKEKSEQAAKRLLKFGTICDCEVIRAENQKSKVKPDGSGGNDMIYLLVKIWTPDGEEKMFDDYLLASFEHKLRHAADTFGVIEKYNLGTLDASDFDGRSGKCKMGIQKDKSGQYPDKNVINDYVKKLPKESIKTGVLEEVQKQFPGAKAITDDEIPF